MKIAFVDTTLEGPIIGGAQTLLVDLAAGLVRKGLEVHIITSGPPERRISDSLIESRAYIHTNLWPKPYLVQDIAPGFASWIHDLDPDVYVVSVSWDIGWAVLPLLRPRIATVTISHLDSAFFYDPVSHYAPYISSAVGVSEAVCERLRSQCGVPQDRIIWIPCGVYPGPKPMSRGQGDSHDALRLVYAARLTDKQKRASDLIRIVKRLRATALNYHLSVAGDGPLLGAFARQLAPDITSGRVTLHGWLNREDLHREMDGSDVFLLTSDSEGFPVALVEAMAHGLAPVVTDIPSGNRQLVCHEENGMLVPVGEIDGFVASIQRLAGDRRLLRKMKIAAWESSQDFTVSRMIESYAECFQAAKQTAGLRAHTPDPAFPLMGRCRSRYPQWLRRLKVTVGRAAHRLNRRTTLSEFGVRGS